MRLASELGTKKNGLEICRKIGKSIALSSGDVVAHEVRKDFQYETTVEDTMRRIAKSLSAEERARIMEDGWRAKLEELIELSLDYRIFDGLPKALAVTNGKDPDAMSSDDSEKNKSEGRGEDDSKDPSDSERSDDERGAEAPSDTASEELQWKPPSF